DYYCQVYDSSTNWIF
nr:immunoglobulin light chain junction region [Macaca mulatta]